ncbi:hypothetical protein D3C75_1354410 [compost metagenome]
MTARLSTSLLCCGDIEATGRLGLLERVRCWALVLTFFVERAAAECVVYPE